MCGLYLADGVEGERHDRILPHDDKDRWQDLCDQLLSKTLRRADVRRVSTPLGLIDPWVSKVT